MAKELIDADIASLPRDGPTTSACIILAGASSLPARRMFAKSEDSSGVKFPVI